MDLKKLVIFDASIASDNLGDKIVMDSVLDQLRGIFPFYFFKTVQTHDVIRGCSYYHINISDLAFVGGTNLISSCMNKTRQWRIGLFDSLFIKGLILMGVGWHSYQREPNWYTKLLLKRILSHKFFHSVRDNYTLNKLSSIGIQNVINTGCPTLWKLTPAHCSQIPEGKSENVVFTFTDYCRNETSDKKIFKMLKQRYKNLFLWLQGTNDYEYLKGIIDNNVKIIPGFVEDYDSLLSSNISLDYVGTRLHAGIRALQHKRRSIILSVDNRAEEKGRDFNLPVVKRDDLDLLEDKVSSSFKTDIKIPTANILQWIAQFVRA